MTHILVIASKCLEIPIFFKNKKNSINFYRKTTNFRKNLNKENLVLLEWASFIPVQWIVLIGYSNDRNDCEMTAARLLTCVEGEGMYQTIVYWVLLR